jgi:choline dehydrogenase-like flavoprotein
VSTTKTRFELDDDSVVVVIGSGAGGGVLADELTARGIKVVMLEAGKHIAQDDFRNDELFAYQQLSWLEPRTASGSWAVAKFSPDLPAWSVRAVGGTSIHWGALAFRMRDHEFAARSRYGAVDGAALADWPVTAAELAPHYARAETRLGVTGTNDIPLLPVTNNYKVLWNGAKRMGYQRIANDRHAINSVPRDGRSVCLQLGFCSQGCKSGAKWSTLYAEIPRALACRPQGSLWLADRGCLRRRARERRRHSGTFLPASRAAHACCGRKGCDARLNAARESLDGHLSHES